MKTLEDLDRWIGSQVKRWTSTWSGAGERQPAEVLEIHRDLLEDVRRHLEPAGQGRYFLPYNQITIQIAAIEEARKTLYSAAFENGTVAGEIRALLTEAGAPLPAGFEIEVHMIDEPELASKDRPFRVDYFQKSVAREIPLERPAAKLVVLRGQTDQTELAITSNRVNIGRLREVVGEKQGLRRFNDVAFDEAEISVSREHAYITYDTDSARFRVCDEQSQRGTSIFRQGRRIEVPRASKRGTQLQAGDEIHLGEARIRFDVPSATG